MTVKNVMLFAVQHTSMSDQPQFWRQVEKMLGYMASGILAYKRGQKALSARLKERHDLPWGQLHLSALRS